MEKSKMAPMESTKILQIDRSQFKSWLKSNSFHSFKDNMGIDWIVEIDYIELPHPNEIHGGIWEVNLHASTNLHSKLLISSGLLNEKQDKRLLSLIGNSQIRLNLNSIHLRADSMEQVRRELAQNLDLIRKKLKNPKVKEIIHAKIGAWVNQNRLFGIRHSADSSI